MGVVNGLNFLEDQIREGRTQVIPIYGEGEVDATQKKHVNLLRLQPENPDPRKESVLLAAGGAYASVCTIAEALPTARHFVEAGHQVFLLTYRVGESEAAIHALEDMARAVRYLQENQRVLSVDIYKLVVGGFSAGANLVSNWGSSRIGYKAFGLPKPKALLPIYTYIDLKAEARKATGGVLVAYMFGPNYEAYIDRYNVVDHIDAEYPPCYIVCGKDDTTVPCSNSEKMKQKLDEYGVHAVLEEREHAQHGFGDGTGTEAEGWPERAMALIGSLQ